MSNRLETIKSFLKFLLKEDNDMFLNDAGVFIKAWMEANGIGALTTNPEFHEQFQQIIPIMNDDTLNTLKKKEFIYNYYWLVMTPDNSEAKPEFLASLAALLLNSNSPDDRRLVAQTSIDQGLQMLFKAAETSPGKELIYSTNLHPSNISAVDVLHNSKKYKSGNEIIQYDDSVGELTIATDTDASTFEINGTSLNPVDISSGNYFQDVESGLSEQASQALKIWMNTANITVE